MRQNVAPPQTKAKNTMEKNGTLKTGISGKIIANPKQLIAIVVSEAKEKRSKTLQTKYVIKNLQAPRNDAINQ